MLRRYIGDRAFYKRALALAVPILVQNGITNFVSLLDNIMVGQIGTLPMTGVSIANQLLLIFNLCILGATAGAGIFTAQFYGKGDIENVRFSHRMKYLVCLLLAVLAIVLFSTAADPLISLYLKGEGSPEDAVQVLRHSKAYMNIMLWGLVPFALTGAYAGTLRETNQTVVPMVGGITAVFVNLFLNYVLIFGHFGAPAMGVRGAALATVISRYVEMLIVVGWTHLNPKRNPFIQGIFRSLYIPKELFFAILRKGMPLLFNEFMWSLGLAVLTQSYSTRGLSVVPALNIADVIYQLTNICAVAFGTAVGIITGQMLGAGEEEEKVRDANRKLIALTVFCGFCMGILLFCFSGVFPQLYNTTDEVRTLATNFIWIISIMLPIASFTFATYFTLRAGGKALITFLFDSCFLWVGPVFLSVILSRFTAISILPLYATCHLIDIVRCVAGAILLDKVKWMARLTE